MGALDLFAATPVVAMRYANTLLSYCGVKVSENPEAFWSDPNRAPLLSKDLQLHVLFASLVYIVSAIVIGELLYKKRGASDATNSTPKSIHPAVAAITSLWNTLLAVCSASGLAMLLCSSPDILTQLLYPSSAYPPVTRFVVCIFCLTKPLEFFDTLLLILRGRKPSFLHIYHRLTVAIYCWHALYANVPFAHGFVAANLFVDSVMYTYFAATEYPATRRLVAFLRPHITLLQLFQMLMGICTSAQVIYNPIVIEQPLAAFNAKLCLAMYISYAFLFFKFYLEAFHKQFRGGMTAFLLMFHIFALVGLVKLWMHKHCWVLFLETLILYAAGGLGITCGAHRLWAHRSYKANALYRCLMIILSSIANQGSVFHWARDHRVHHKFSDKEADPYNAMRGFFYSHVGWLLLRKPSTVSNAGKFLDHDDLLEDVFVRIQHRLDPYWNQFFCFLLPSIYAYFRYGEFWTGFFILGCLRWSICLNATWNVNSVCHIWGDRPYDNSCEPCESVFTAVFAVGEGWHNWHHLYPHDYSAAEGEAWEHYNPSKLLIDIFAKLGMVWDRKRALGAWAIKSERRTKERQERHEMAREFIKNTPILCFAENLRSFINQKCASITSYRSFVRLSCDLLVLATCLVLTRFCVAYLDSLSIFSVLNVSLTVLNIVGIIILGLIMGTVYFSLLMHSFLLANGTFTKSSRISNILGSIISIFLMVPYQSKRFNVPGETPAIRPFLFSSCFALFKIASWSTLFHVSMGTIAWSSVLFYALLHGYALQTLAYYFLPYIVNNIWILFYFVKLEKRGPHDVKNNNFRYDFCFVSPSAIRWVLSVIERRKRSRTRPLDFLLNLIHMNILNMHLLQAVTFEVPFYKSREACELLRQRIYALHIDLLSLPLGSNGFEICNPKARVEEYDTNNSCFGVNKKAEGVLDYTTLCTEMKTAKQKLHSSDEVPAVSRRAIGS